MRHNAEREELIRLVRRIMEPPPGSTEEEEDAAVAELRRRVVMPAVSDLIFYPERTPARTLLQGRESLTPEEIVDAALAYKPIELGPAG